MIDVIKEYMVSLGVDIDEKGFNDFKRTLQGADKATESFVANFGKNFVKAGIALTGVLVAANTATASILKTVSDADLKYEKLARTLWTTKENAKSMQIVLDAMGQSKEDVMWIPELNQQYRELASLGKQMRAPDELSNQMKSIRSIGFEFTRLKMEATYAMEWIAYYLVKYLGEPLAKMKKSMSDFNDKIVKEMPRKTKNIAFGLSSLFKMGLSVVRMVTTLWERFEKFWDSLPSGVRKAAFALSALAAVIMSGPIGWITAGLAFALILLEDFFGYIDGKESSQTLAPIWDKVIKVLDWIDKSLYDVSDGIDDFYNKMEDSKSLKEFWEVIKDLAGSVYELGEFITVNVINGIKDLYSYLDENGSVTNMTDAVENQHSAFIELAKGISNVYKETKKWFEYIMRQSAFKQWWSDFKKTLGGAVDIAAALITHLGDIGKVVGLLLQGKWSEAGSLLMSSVMKNGKKALGGAWDLGTGAVGMLGSAWATNGSAIGLGREGKTWRREVDSVDIEGLDPMAIEAINDLSAAYKAMYGEDLVVSSGKRTWGGHVSGKKFDVVDSFDSTAIEGNKDGRRDWLKEYARSRGLIILDAYAGEEGPNADPHLDFDARNYQPSSSAFANSVSTAIGDVSINLYPPAGTSNADIANGITSGLSGMSRGSFSFEEMRNNRALAGVSPG